MTLLYFSVVQGKHKHYFAVGKHKKDTLPSYLPVNAQLLGNSLNPTVNYNLMPEIFPSQMYQPPSYSQNNFDSDQNHENDFPGLDSDQIRDMLDTSVLEGGIDVKSDYLNELFLQEMKEKQTAYKIKDPHLDKLLSDLSDYLTVLLRFKKRLNIQKSKK